METVLLVGGAGFIGSHLVASLSAEGIAVAVYDSQRRPSADDTFVQKYTEFRWDAARAKAAAWYTEDARQRDKAIEAVRAQPVDVVVYLPALLSVESAYHWQEAYSVQVEGLSNFLDAALGQPSIKRFVYVSSSYVYGDFRQIPAGEDHRRLPVDVYGRCKLIGEELLKLYASKAGFEFAILRLSGVYGFGDTHIGSERIAPTLVHCALENRPITLKSAGSKIDFTYVKDAVQGVVLAMTHDYAANEAFNISRGEARTIGDFARIVRHSVPDFQLTIRDERPCSTPGVPTRGALDIRKARTVLGYEPRFSLERGVEDYIREYSRNAPSWRSA